jgi:hypothetical protein
VKRKGQETNEMEDSPELKTIPKALFIVAESRLCNWEADIVISEWVGR